ncbi:YopX family protein [Bacillus atrophaeus]|uniref:YopX family protein n=1 Tax=Bacillus atrophaeus TaxID=1452 RepID=UPI002281A144|nr:YopX family protein [Bacillus atrophaeus]MCY8856448.1 YopX family protein [Bacillus atrophaeus]
MREIKFRMYSKKKKVMHYWDHIKQFQMAALDDNDENEKYSPWMQYTGLEDTKNGREIYEEDIIQTSYMKIRGCAYRCVFSAEFGGYLFDPFVIGDKDAPLLGIEEFAQEWEEVKHGEVIGNIYENPKLLSN